MVVLLGFLGLLVGAGRPFFGLGFSSYLGYSRQPIDLYSFISPVEGAFRGIGVAPRKEDRASDEARGGVAREQPTRDAPLRGPVGVGKKRGGRDDVSTAEELQPVD